MDRFVAVVALPDNAPTNVVAFTTPLYWKDIPALAPVVKSQTYKFSSVIKLAPPENPNLLPAAVLAICILVLPEFTVLVPTITIGNLPVPFTSNLYDGLFVPIPTSPAKYVVPVCPLILNIVAESLRVSVISALLLLLLFTWKYESVSYPKALNVGAFVAPAAAYDLTSNVADGLIVPIPTLPPFKSDITSRAPPSVNLNLSVVPP